MSDTPYEKECLYCKQKIRMSKETGKWLPYNLNNGQHDCRTKKEEESKQETSTQQDREVRIDLVIKKVRAIIGDLEDLKNE